jgi:hypothetical protein
LVQGQVLFIGEIIKKKCKNCVGEGVIKNFLENYLARKAQIYMKVFYIVQIQIMVVRGPMGSQKGKSYLHMFIL